MSVSVTALYCGLILLLACALQFWVIRGRWEHGVGLGDGGNETVLRRMRAQGNFIETAPLLVIAMALMELSGAAGWFLHLFGIVLVVSRVAHPIGMLNRYPDLPLRVGSTAATLGLFLVAAVSLIFLSFFS